MQHQTEWSLKQCRIKNGKETRSFPNRNPFILYSFLFYWLSERYNILESFSRVMRARPAFFDFCVHRFPISPQTTHDQRIACEGFTCKAFTQSSPFPSPQPSLYELVRSEVKGEHRKSELGEVRVRDRDVCIGACPRDENTAAGEGKIERARRKVEKCGTIRFDCRDGGRTR